MPDDYYVSQYSGEEIDERLTAAHNAVRYDTAQSLTDAQKTQARGNIAAAKSTFLGNIPRNKIYKIGYFFKGSGESSSGAIAIRIRNFSDYGNENYMLAFLGPYGFSIEYHGQVITTYISKISVYSDTSVTGSAKKYTVFVTTQDYVDWASVYIENEHSFTRNFEDVTDTFSALVDGLDKVWESEYEYANPPMQLGIEYRTTERYMGKPVYVKVVDCGAMPSVTTKTVGVGVENLLRKVSVEAMMYYSVTDNWTLPLHNGSFDVDVWFNHQGISIRVQQSGLSSYTCYATIKYTKTTD